MFYYGSFVLQCYVLRMRVMTSAVGGNLTNRPPALRHKHVKRIVCQVGYLQELYREALSTKRNVIRVSVKFNDSEFSI